MSATSSPTSTKSSHYGELKKSSTYFFRGGDLFFLVGGIYYKVNSIFFERESIVFKKLFASGDDAVGSSLSTAILLDDVSPAEFERFLWVFYNREFSIYEASVEDWSDILHLANRWKFTEVKKLAIRELQALKTIDLVDRIVLYKAYDVGAEFINPLYAALCARDEPLNQAESQKLGVETTVLIFQARERLRSREQDNVKSPLPEDIDQGEVLKIVSQLLGEPSNEDVVSGGWTPPALRPLRRSRRSPVATMAFTPPGQKETEVIRQTVSEAGHARIPSCQNSEKGLVAQAQEDVDDQEVLAEVALLLGRRKRVSILSTRRRLDNRRGSRSSSCDSRSGYVLIPRPFPESPRLPGAWIS